MTVTVRPVFHVTEQNLNICLYKDAYGLSFKIT